MQVVRNLYKSRLVCYEDEAYDLPLDVVYFIASSWNDRLNNYVYTHKSDIEKLLSENIGGFFPYKLEIISPDRFQEESIRNGFRSLHPEWGQEIDFMPINEESSETCRMTYQAEALKRMVDKTLRFEESFICRIAPSATETTFGFYVIDISLCTETIIQDILRDFVRDLTQYNLMALSSGVDYSEDAIVEKVVRSLQSPISFSGKGISFCGQNQEDGNAHDAIKKINIDPSLRELALRIKQEIDSYQRKNGVNTLLEKLGNDFI